MNANRNEAKNDVVSFFSSFFRSAYTYFNEYHTLLRRRTHFTQQSTKNTPLKIEDERKKRESK